MVELNARLNFKYFWLSSVSVAKKVSKILEIKLSILVMNNLATKIKLKFFSIFIAILPKKLSSFSLSLLGKQIEIFAIITNISSSNKVSKVL